MAISLGMSHPNISNFCHVKVYREVQRRGFKLNTSVRVCLKSEMIGGKEESKAPLRILIAGGGIGGLVLALAAKNKGFDVKVFERDLSAVRGEGQYRGPIQIQSNALGALEAVDADVADKIMENGCVTGDRINGLVDGLTGKWYVKFDTYTPAVERGLPVTRVISRMTLQQILAHSVGPDIIENSCNVVDFNDDGKKVTIMLEDGREYEGDLLVGADGIRSKVRKKLFGPKEATYSEYTCYTGIADFVPPDIENVGYRVFLGYKQYFVSSDVGGGKMQWYAFHNEPAGNDDPQNCRKKRVLELFGNWCEKVVDLLLATPEDMILRRDIYDREPMLTWSKGRVTLLGDSAHAMQPNMGQGGCMAIEDSYQLALELEKAYKASLETEKSVDIASALKRYEKERILRVGAIHGMARMAAIMASTYKPYLGVGLGPLSSLTKLRIPHPGRVGGRFVLGLVMPTMLGWVLGGNSSKLEGWSPRCRLSDKASNELHRWFQDDDAMERAIDADWCLIDADHQMPNGTSTAIRLSRDENRPTIIGRTACASTEGVPAILPYSKVSERHASIVCKENTFFVMDLGSEHGSWITDEEGRSYRIPSKVPERIRPGYVIQFGRDRQAVLRVKLYKRLPQENYVKRDTPVLGAV
uniref:Zeaxanthin epoxidase, chloroplastic n=1 Tax=Wollemia nobilis TaxID=56998 RepID=A0A0C9S4T5_9CONI